MSKDNEQILRIMRGLKVSKEEAQEIWECDKAIDRDEEMPFDLPLAKLNIARKFAHTGTREKKEMSTSGPTTYSFPKKNRKENATKAGIITELFKFLCENSEFSTENVVITNKERQISFGIGPENYELTLVQKRKKKE